MEAQEELFGDEVRSVGAMILDATFKGQGRMTMEELCLYEVKDNKSILEEFHF